MTSQILKIAQDMNHGLMCERKPLRQNMAPSQHVLGSIHGLASCALGGAVLEDGDGTDMAQVYNPKTAIWTEVAPMQIARSGSAACTLKGKIYVIGTRLVGSFTEHNRRSYCSNFKRKLSVHGFDQISG